MTIINVSNRLPVTLSPAALATSAAAAAKPKVVVGGYDFRPSGGGLVSGLDGVRRRAAAIELLWVGWPGCEVAASARAAVDVRLRQLGCAAVYIEQPLADSYYSGYCNRTLWPLLHNFVSHAAYREHWSRAYTEVNQRFADAVLDVAADGDAVWVHDYHLMHLPRLLRSPRSDAGGGGGGAAQQPTRRLRVGVFVHTNFPPPEVFALVPQARALLASLAHADLVAFHLERYARNFAACCEALLGFVGFDVRAAKAGPGGIVVPGSPPPPLPRPRLAAVPLGIDVRQILEAVDSKATLEHVRTLERRYGGAGERLALAVDRVDYIKGIEHKLRAFELFLEGGGGGGGDDAALVLEQVAVPSCRDDIASYARLERRVARRCAAINSRFGRQAVRYRRQSLDLNELVALYRCADMCIVSSLSDGLNLVALEYVAAQRGRRGALILSQQAGCAELLRTPLTVNPLDADGFAATIRRAIGMSDDEREALQSSLFDVVASHTCEAWARQFAFHLGHAL